MRSGKLIKTALKGSVSIGVLGLLFSRMDRDRMFEILKGIEPGVLLLAVLVFVLAQSVSTLRWRILLPGRYGYGRLFSLYFIGSFFNNFLPTAIGGDLVKTYYLYRDERDLGAATTAVFMDRYVGMAALLVMGSTGMYLTRRIVVSEMLPAAYALLVSGYLLSVFFLWRVPWDRWIKRLRTFREPLLRYEARKGSVLKALLLSFIVQFLVISCVAVLGRGLGLDLEAKYYLAFVPMASVISMIPVSISGIGLRESAMAYLLGRIGIGIEEAVTLSLLWYGTVAVSSLIGAVEYVRIGSLEKKRD